MTHSVEPSHTRNLEGYEVGDGHAQIDTHQNLDDGLRSVAVVVPRHGGNLEVGNRHSAATNHRHNHQRKHHNTDTTNPVHCTAPEEYSPVQTAQAR